MSDAFWRRDNADITKKLDAEALEVAGVLVHQLRVQAGAQPVTLKFDAVSDSLYYIGQAKPGALITEPVWALRQMVINGANVTLLWADGNAIADKIWNDRASYTYFEG